VLPEATLMVCAQVVGNEKAAAIAKKAMADGATIRETVVAMGLVEDGTLTEEQLDAALDVRRMTHP
jgi:fumarate hydratase class II